MTLEQAIQAADILNKINSNNEIINNLKFIITINIKFSKGGNEPTLILTNDELVDNIVKYTIDVLTEEIRELEDKLKLF